MKKTQKILIMLAICLISIGVVGCSSNKEEDKKNIATQKKENKSSKLSGEEIFKKVNDATKEIKSSKRKMDYSEIMSAAGKKTETLVNTEAITTDNPSITKLYSTVNLLEKKSSVESYFTDGVVYAKNEKSNEWFSIEDEELKKSLYTEKEFTEINGIMEIMNSVKDKLKMEEKDSEYEITYSGADASIKDYLKKVTFMDEDVLEKLLDIVDIEKIEINYKVDKSTFMPKEYTLQIKLKIREGKEDDHFKINLKAVYSEINKVEPIKLPDEVKNAQEYKGN